MFYSKNPCTIYIEIENPNAERNPDQVKNLPQWSAGAALQVGYVGVCKILIQSGLACLVVLNFEINPILRIPAPT